MNKSKIPTVAKAVHKALLNSESKDVELYVKGNKYIVIEAYSEPPEWAVCSFKGSGAITIQYYYPDSNIPTVEQIEKSLIDTFITVRS